MFLAVFFEIFYPGRRAAKGVFPKNFGKIRPKSELRLRFSPLFRFSALALYIIAIRQWYLCRMIYVILPNCGKKNF